MGDTISVRINGQYERLSGSLSVKALAERLGFDKFYAELNAEPVNDQCMINDGDDIDIREQL